MLRGMYGINSLQEKKINQIKNICYMINDSNILGLDNFRGDNKTVQSFHNFKELYYEWYEDNQSMQASINIV